METMVIKIRTRKDKFLLSTLAQRLHLKAKFITEENKEYFGLLKAMLEAKTGDYVERGIIIKTLRK